MQYKSSYRHLNEMKLPFHFPLFIEMMDYPFKRHNILMTTIAYWFASTPPFKIEATQIKYFLQYFKEIVFCAKPNWNEKNSIQPVFDD